MGHFTFYFFEEFKHDVFLVNLLIEKLAFLKGLLGPLI